jgi:hypothetical protein
LINRRTAVLTTIALGLGFTQTPKARAQDASPAAAMTEDGLRELEEFRLRSLVDFDLEAASALHADDYQLINPSGTSLSRDAYLGDLASGFVDYLVFEATSHIEVHLQERSGILRYQSSIELILGGSRVPLSTYWHTDYYEERDGRWLAVWSQATEIVS